MPQLVLPRIGKLVRDKVPERIRTNGEEPDVAHIRPKALGRHLALKIYEEAREIVFAHIRRDRAQMVEEAADVLEAYESFLEHEGISREEVAAARAEKARTHGRFTKGHLLLGTKQKKEL